MNKHLPKQPLQFLSSIYLVAAFNALGALLVGTGASVLLGSKFEPQILDVFPLLADSAVAWASVGAGAVILVIGNLKLKSIYGSVKKSGAKLP